MQNILQHNDKNRFVCTLNEKREDVGSGQLFELYDPSSDWSKTFVQNNNLSIYKERYDEFEITLTGETSEDRTKGVINVEKEIGDLRYKVYEQSSGSTNLDISGTTENVLEQGYIKLKNDQYTGLTQTNNYNIPDDNKTYYV